MATNPRVPSEGPKRPQLVVRYRKKGFKHRFREMRVPLLAALIAFVLLALATYYIPRARLRTVPKASAGPVFHESNNGDVQAAHVQISSPSTTTAVTLTGEVTNSGKRSFRGATVELAFRDASGAIVQTVERPIAGIAGGNCEVPDEFVRHPLQPNDLRFFCVSVSPVPEGWNHQVPDVQVSSVVSK